MIHFVPDNLNFIPDSERFALIESIQAKYWSHIRAKGYFLIVRPYIRPQNVGGVAIPESMRDEDQHHSVAAQVIDIGPLAYTNAAITGGIAWAQIGDWVFIPRVAGARVGFKDGDSDVVLRIVKEDDIIAVISDPSEWEIRITQTRY